MFSAVAQKERFGAMGGANDMKSFGNTRLHQQKASRDFADGCELAGEKLYQPFDGQRIH